MKTEWQYLKIEDVAERVGMGPFGSSIKVSTFVEKGIPVISGQHLHGFRLEDNEYNFVSAEHADKLKSANVQRGDVVFTHAGSIGQVSFIPDSSKFDRYVISQRQFFLRCDKSKIIPEFITYYFRSREGQHKLLANASQVGVPSISRPVSNLRAIRVPVPPLNEQKRIAHILGTLDDKIELNRKMNATLEAMARALFKSWFVDFDPVRAKMEGRQPEGMDEETAALFPDGFEDSAIGPVPKGWKVERLDAHITADRGLSYNGEGLRDDGTGLPMHNLNSIYEGGGYKHEGIKYYAGEHRDRHLVSAGDMIVTNTEQGFDHLLIGHAAIVPKRYGAKGIFSHHIYRVKFKSTSPLTPHYLVELFNNPRWHYWISGFSNGTTINMLPLDALQMPLLVIPPEKLIERFTKLTQATHEQVEGNLEQSTTLTKLRESLLPKLLCGTEFGSAGDQDELTLGP